MNVIEIVPIGKDIVVALAAIIAAGVGIRGLTAWRHQLSGNIEYRLAKDILTSIYDVRDTIDAIRNPLISYSREPDLPKEKLETLSTRQRDWHALVQAYERRWRPLQAIVTRLETNLLEAEVVWGKAAVDRVRKLSSLVTELHWATRSYLEARNPEEGDDKAGELFDAKQRSTLYGGRKTDEFKDQVNQAIRDVEKELKPHIERYHRQRKHR